MGLNIVDVNVRNSTFNVLNSTFFYFCDFFTFLVFFNICERFTSMVFTTDWRFISFLLSSHDESVVWSVHLC